MVYILSTVIIEYLMYHYINLGIEARKAIAANNGIQATLIAIEIGSQDPEIQSCGLALLACAIIESMLISLQAINRISRVNNLEVTCSNLDLNSVFYQADFHML